MAELTEISLNIKVEGKALETLNSQIGKLASTIETTGKIIDSTFRGISRELELLAMKVRDTKDEISLFGISFDALKDQTGTLSTLKKAIDGFKQEVVNTNIDFLKDLTAFIILLTRAIDNFGEEHPKLTKFLTTMAAIGAVVLPLVLAFGALAGVAKAVGAVFAVSGLEIATIAAVIALVVAAVVLLIQNWDLVKEKTQEVWENVKESVSNAVDSVVQSIEGTSQRVSNLWEGLKESAASAWEGIKETVSEKIISLLQVFDLIKENVSEKFNTAIETIKTLWSNGIQFIKDNTRLDEFVLSLAESVLKIFDKMIEGLKQLWNNFLAFLKENFPEVFDAADFIKEKLSNARDFVGEKIDAAGDTITNAADVVSGFLKEKSGDLNNFLSERLGELTSFTSNQLETASNFVKEQASNVGNFVEEQASNAKESLKTAFSGENIINAIQFSGPIEFLAAQTAKPLANFTRGAVEEFKKIRKELDETGDQSNKTGEDVSLLESILRSLRGETSLVDKSLVTNAQSLSNYSENVNQAGEATKKWTEEELQAVIQKIQEINDTLPKITFREIFPGVKVPFVEVKEDIKDVGETFKETSETAQKSLDELGVFAADIASEINNTFADLIFRGLKGNLDSLSDLWDSTLDAMLNTFAQFAAAIISNPIRVVLDAVLRGENGSGGGGNGGGKGFFGSLGGIFDIGKGFKTIGKGLSKIPGVSSIIDSVKGLFAEGGALAGIGSFLSSALPVIGAIASVISFAIPLISGLFKKTPRLDIDFDSIKTETGRRATQVAEFLDADFFKDSIAQISVKRGAGLGVGGDDAIKDIIQKKIKETIEAVQAIIFKLPSEMAAQLNEALLNTKVDTETVVKGERLLEFDAKGKEIKKKFEAFVNGELQAKFLFAIRDFFQGAFESLGVLPGKAGEFLDAEFEKFKKAGSREERAKVGEELLASFNAFVDAFNIVSGNINDSIGETIERDEWQYRLAV